MLESLGAIIWVIGAGAWIGVIIKILWLATMVACLPATALLILRRRRSRR
jgi:hypothetical protein